MMKLPDILDWSLLAFVCLTSVACLVVFIVIVVNGSLKMFG